MFRTVFDGLSVDDFVCRCDFSITGESYCGAAAGCLSFSFLIHIIIISMFYHLLSVTCCVINKRRETILKTSLLMFNYILVGYKLLLLFVIPVLSIPTVA